MYVEYSYKPSNSDGLTLFCFVVVFFCPSSFRFKHRKYHLTTTVFIDYKYSAAKCNVLSLSVCFAVLSPFFFFYGVFLSVFSIINVKCAELKVTYKSP